MSGNNPKKSKRWPVAVALVILLAALCAAVVWLLAGPGDAPTQPTAPSDAGSETTPATHGSIPETTDTVQTSPAETKPVQVDELTEAAIDLGNGMYVTDVGKYTGVYMEDGSDEIVSGVLMIAVTNLGDSAVQYAQISMPVDGQTANFVLSTLPVGSTVILLEQNRMAYVPGEYTEAAASSVALFSEPLSLCQDRLKIQILDGAINITNISGKAISGDIVIYYKNAAADVYYGGITYRVRLEGGMEADEVRQVVASHFSAAGSAIMFVTCGDN